MYKSSRDLHGLTEVDLKLKSAATCKSINFCVLVYEKLGGGESYRDVGVPAVEEGVERYPQHAAQAHEGRQVAPHHLQIPVSWLFM